MEEKFQDALCVERDAVKHCHAIVDCNSCYAWTFREVGRVLMDMALCNYHQRLPVRMKLRPGQSFPQSSTLQCLCRLPHDSMDGVTLASSFIQRTLPQKSCASTYIIHVSQSAQVEDIRRSSESFRLGRSPKSRHSVVERTIPYH